ncbi:MAG: c-type cytochrome [Rhodospirillales bacterium]|nr:c-type cytochrome [Rhodospirillales bacterium]
MTALRILAAALAVALVPASGAMAQGVSPAALSEACAGCHGSDGTTNGAAPTIANLKEEYFVASMQDYKSGKRAATVMGRIAKGYSDDEIKAMAKYFDTKPFGRHAQKFDDAKAKTGAGLHKKYCDSCHEDNGRKSDGIGVLAGQAADYLAFSMADFKSGKREMEKRKKQKVDALFEEQGPAGVDALVHYYASQK